MWLIKLAKGGSFAFNYEALIIFGRESGGSSHRAKMLFSCKFSTVCPPYVIGARWQEPRPRTPYLDVVMYANSHLFAIIFLQMGFSCWFTFMFAMSNMFRVRLTAYLWFAPDGRWKWILGSEGKCNLLCSSICVMKIYSNHELKGWLRKDIT